MGTLHEISSENSTVALENVTSYGTEGRRPDEEVAPNLDHIYEYIVFRGSDVKDLRIEEGPKEVKKPDPPGFPDDPAILGVSHSSAKGKMAFGPNKICINSDEILRMLNYLTHLKAQNTCGYLRCLPSELSDIFLFHDVACESRY